VQAANKMDKLTRIHTFGIFRAASSHCRDCRCPAPDPAAAEATYLSL
jgi:hypothetical protein